MDLCSAQFIKEQRLGGDDAVRPEFLETPGELPAQAQNIYRAHQDLIGLRRRNPWLTTATTTKLHRDRDSVGMPKLKKDAKDGGAVAGRTRKDIEQQSGKPVISPGNFKQLAAKPVSRVKKIKGSEG